MADSRYRITERVASGGMAEVFKGVAESLQGFKKNIALKRILPALTQNKKFVAMFLDEARLSLSLQHANIVQVFDIGHADDTYFIVMEYVDGVDLKGLIEWRRRIGKRLPTATSLYIINEVCKGLSYAHEMVNPETGKPLGIVHRDISPPNVLISKQGEVKVVDFGLAKATSQLETTDPGVVKGKMSYLSPEAARGDEVDSRADIFSVGILLYELLTGKRLFYGETDYQTVELVRNAKIPPDQGPEPGGRTGIGRRRSPGPGQAQRRSLSDRDGPSGCVGAIRLFARVEGHRARRRRFGPPVPGRQGSRVRRKAPRGKHPGHVAPGRNQQVHLGRLRGSGRKARVTGRSAIDHNLGE